MVVSAIPDKLRNDSYDSQSQSLDDRVKASELSRAVWCCGLGRKGLVSSLPDAIKGNDSRFAYAAAHLRINHLLMIKDALKKMKLESPGIALNTPPPYLASLRKLDFLDSIPEELTDLNALVFIQSAKEFHNFLSDYLKRFEPDTRIWIAYPKGTSGVKTDVNRDRLRDMGEKFGLRTVTAVSIDETWSALRFRPAEKVGK